MSQHEIKVRFTTLDGKTKQLSVHRQARMHTIDQRLGGGNMYYYYGRPVKIIGNNLEAMGVQENGMLNNEIVVIKKRPPPFNGSVSGVAGPTVTKADIEAATKHLPEATAKQSDTPTPTDRNTLRQIIYTCLAIACELQRIPFDVPDTSVTEVDPNFDPYAHVDEPALSNLQSMGFSTALSRKALALNRGSPMLAVEWIMELPEDYDENAALTPHQIQYIQKQLAESRTASTATTSYMLDMGFHPADVAASLVINRSNPGQCVDWLLGDRHGNDLFDENWDEVSMEQRVTVLPPDDPLVLEILDDSGVRDTLSSPRAHTVFSEIFDDLSAITRYLPDPDLGPVLVFITRAAQKTNVDS